MSNIVFKQVQTEEHIVQIEKLGEKIWNEHYINIISQDQIDYMLEKFQSKESIKKQIEKHYEYYLIKQNNENIGYIGMQPQEDKLFLSKLYIKAEKRGQGLGREAFNFIKGKCFEKNLKSIRLTVNKYNLSSIEVYKKIGFRILESVATSIGNGYIMDDYIMEYSLRG